MKSIKQHLEEVDEKIEWAIAAENRYVDLQEDYVKCGDSDELASQLLEASKEKKGALRQAIKAVKDLYVLFDMEAPQLKYLYDIREGYYTIKWRWDYMTSAANKVFSF